MTKTSSRSGGKDIGTLIVASLFIGLGLIIVGLLWLRRERREPVEKQPEADVSG